MNRYHGIGLENPLNTHNVSAILNAASVYDTKFVAATGTRFDSGSIITASTDSTVPLLRPTSLLEVIPHDCVPVAIAYTINSIMLPEYIHPERAFYIFSADDEELSKGITDRCADIIRLPIIKDMNLTAQVNVILYDRICKAWNSKREIT